ncbi:polysaccharide deacetylase family protein [Rhodoplanes roseus]|uniref:Chitooligosaccharide deacetylase n=1 Tax=Rhodoplanes roseus TaxID=29409 RepID=A0A327KTT0_9BRAD|nr:polysaccharide deacetylase family protein [Rhodoplanes roseus]RAI38728.1 hypothetical protein CH341_27300 [Rhodoplanes roseus]
MPRHIVCLSVDLDVSDRDACEVGAARLLDLLKDRGLRSTWFVPGHAPGTDRALCERLVRDGHEIGVLAAASHPETAVMQAVEAIRDVAGAPPCGFRTTSGHEPGPGTPAWRGVPGFAYDSSRAGLSWWPTRLRPHGTGAPSAADLIDMPITLTLGGPSMPARAVLQDWSDEFLFMRESVNFGVLTCAMPLATIARGAWLRAFGSFLDTVTAGTAAVLTLDAAAREAGERIGI